MSEHRQIKKIDMDTLEGAERKVSRGKLRRAGLAVIVFLVVAAGGYAAYRVIVGEVIASRFTVNRMTCPACVITVKEVTAKVPGVVEADVSLAAQDVIVKFREKRTSPDAIRNAIAQAGYPVKPDGLFRPSGAGIDDPVVAGVHGKPVFLRDIKVPLAVRKTQTGTPDAAASAFSVIGKEVLLHAADAATIVVQPYEIEEEVQRIFREQGLSRDEFTVWMTSTYGAPEKYYQVVGQRLGIRKLIDEHVLKGVTDSEARKRKVLEWAGNLFKDADVQVLDPGFKEKLHASAGQDEWKTFWPRMISRDSELKSLLLQ